MTGNEIASLMRIGLAAVQEAGSIALHYFRTDMSVGNKLGGGAFDPVTQADTGIEAFLREKLEAATPGLRIVGEEFGTSGDGADYWIIDPIDGTRAFMSGMPTWGILLGLVAGGKAVGGIMHQPFTGETFVADPQHGSRLLRHGQNFVLRGSPRSDLASAVLYSTDPVMLARGGIASGFAYDIVPLIAIIEGAGGVVTNLEGASPLAGGNVVAAGNADLHAQAIRFFGQG